MDHRQKMVVVSQSKIKIEDDDEDDLDALRLAALETLRTKDTSYKRSMQLQKVPAQIAQSAHYPYKNQWPMKKNVYYKAQQRQNGNVYYQSPRNPNLIAIVPVDEPSSHIQLSSAVKKIESCIESCPKEVSKFHRFKDNGSGSEDEDTKEQKDMVTSVKTEIVAKKETEDLLETENQGEIMESLQNNGNNQEEDGNDDDDDILLMADLEEENSLDRLMDEMEREMNNGKPSENREKKLSRNKTKDTIKVNEKIKNFDPKTKSDESFGKIERNNTTTLYPNTVGKNDRRSVSPHINQISQKRRSLSPRSRSRKKTPKRSPKRSPVRQMKKSPRESTRYRSPPRSPSSRYSPRSRSPRISPRRSPNRISTKRSPSKKLSPKSRSPKLLSHSRSPRPHRSKSPRRQSRSKSPKQRSPKISRSKSPPLSRSRSPMYSPRYSSPLRSPRLSKSPRLSPRRGSPRRLRSKSPASSPLFCLRSPKVSPRRIPSCLKSPQLSPHRSPWSSPRLSPHLSPRRKRSPKWSPKELVRKRTSRSITPDNRIEYTRDLSPTFKGATMQETSRGKTKQKDEVYERAPTTETKESDTNSDSILEARRKKFESTRPINPVNTNKKIKLSKKHTTNTRAKSSEETEIQLDSIPVRKVKQTLDEYNVQEIDHVDICLESSYEFEGFEEKIENTSPSDVTDSVNTCMDIEPQKTEKEKSSKKKKRRDKELYQVKLKAELPLSERIGKDKKCKKHKEIISDEDVDAIFGDIAIDEEGDLRTALSRKRAEKLNRAVPIQSARLVQSAFKGVVNEAVKSNAKANQRHVINADEKSNQKEIRRVTVLHRSLTELHNSGDESTIDSKVPVRFRLGHNKQVQESKESKIIRKASKRQGRKVKHKLHLSLKNPEYIL